MDGRPQPRVHTRQGQVGPGCRAWHSSARCLVAGMSQRGHRGRWGRCCVCLWLRAAIRLRSRPGTRRPLSVAGRGERGWRYPECWAGRLLERSRHGLRLDLGTGTRWKSREDARARGDGASSTPAPPPQPRPSCRSTSSPHPACRGQPRLGPAAPNGPDPSRGGAPAGPRGMPWHRASPWHAGSDAPWWAFALAAPAPRSPGAANRISAPRSSTRGPTRVPVPHHSRTAAHLRRGARILPSASGLHRAGPRRTGGTGGLRGHCRAAPACAGEAALRHRAAPPAAASLLLRLLFLVPASILPSRSIPPSLRQRPPSPGAPASSSPTSRPQNTFAPSLPLLS